MVSYYLLTHHTPSSTVEAVLVLGLVVLFVLVIIAVLFTSGEGD